MANINKLITAPKEFGDTAYSDINSIYEQVIPYLTKNINYNSTTVALATTDKNRNDALPKFAYQMRVEEAIKTAIDTYLIHEKWQDGISIVSYLKKTINTFTFNLIHEDCKESKRYIGFGCPLCKEIRVKELLENNGCNVLICKSCTNQLKTLESSNSHHKAIHDKIALLKVFATHSIDGVKCPNCNKFVPNSIKTEFGFDCPYPGCKTHFDNCEPLKHPIVFENRRFISTNQPLVANSSSQKIFASTELGDLYCDSGANAHALLSNEEEFLEKFTIISQTIDAQKKINISSRKLPNKLTMYEAFKEVLYEYPQEMINYIIIGGRDGEVAIQSLIFQKFSAIMKHKLPISIFSKGEHVYIDNPLDKRLNLFEGIRQFTNFIDHNLILKKKDRYSVQPGGLIEDSSKHFIGKLISIEDMHGNNLIDCIDYYNFISIKFEYTDKIKVGDDVIAKYYSILPSYTIGSMVHMQRIKKRIKDSVHKKLGLA